MNLALVNSRVNGRRLSPMTDLFDQLLADVARPLPTRPVAGFLPTADVVETDTAFELHLALPGFRKEDVRLHVEKNQLTISGERPRPTDEEGRTYRVTETRFGAFERTFTLPDSVDANQISATLDLGILTVKLPKDAQKTAKLSIEIQ